MSEQPLKKSKIVPFVYRLNPIAHKLKSVTCQDIGVTRPDIGPLSVVMLKETDSLSHALELMNQIGCESLPIHVKDIVRRVCTHFD